MQREKKKEENQFTSYLWNESQNVKINEPIYQPKLTTGVAFHFLLHIYISFFEPKKKWQKNSKCKKRIKPKNRLKKMQNEK